MDPVNQRAPDRSSSTPGASSTPPNAPASGNSPLTISVHTDLVRESYSPVRSLSSAIYRSASSGTSSSGGIIAGSGIGGAGGGNRGSGDGGGGVSWLGLGPRVVETPRENFGMGMGLQRTGSSGSGTAGRLRKTSAPTRRAAGTEMVGASASGMAGGRLVFDDGTRSGTPRQQADPIGLTNDRENGNFHAGDGLERDASRETPSDAISIPIVASPSPLSQSEYPLQPSPSQLDDLNTQPTLGVSPELGSTSTSTRSRFANTVSSHLSSLERGGMRRNLPGKRVWKGVLTGMRSAVDSLATGSSPSETDGIGMSRLGNPTGGSSSLSSSSTAAASKWLNLLWVSDSNHNSFQVIDEDPVREEQETLAQGSESRTSNPGNVLRDRRQSDASRTRLGLNRPRSPHAHSILRRDSSSYPPPSKLYLMIVSIAHKLGIPLPSTLNNIPTVSPHGRLPLLSRFVVIVLFVLLFLGIRDMIFFQEPTPTTTTAPTQSQTRTQKRPNRNAPKPISTKGFKNPFVILNSLDPPLHGLPEEYLKNGRKRKRTDVETLDKSFSPPFRDLYLSPLQQGKSDSPTKLKHLKYSRSSSFEAPSEKGNYNFQLDEEAELARFQQQDRFVGVDGDDSSNQADTTAIVLSYSRVENVRAVVGHLCRFVADGIEDFDIENKGGTGRERRERRGEKGFIKQVLVWNNNPSIWLGRETFSASLCPHPHSLRIHNSPSNLLFLSRFLACSMATTAYCYVQDDDWINNGLRSGREVFRMTRGDKSKTSQSERLRQRKGDVDEEWNEDDGTEGKWETDVEKEDGGPVLTFTSDKMSVMEKWEWCFFNSPSLHTCFAWLGTGAFFSRLSALRILREASSPSASSLLFSPSQFNPWSEKTTARVTRTSANPKFGTFDKNELAMLDTYFTTMRNEPPYALSERELRALPQRSGWSDGQDGRGRNKKYIEKGMERVVNLLGIDSPDSTARFQPPLLPASRSLTTRPHSNPPILPNSQPPFRHPHAHQFRSPCFSDTCIFLTNVPMLPPPDAVTFPGFQVGGDKNSTVGLGDWEAALGWVGRGWLEGVGGLWDDGETWNVNWGYGGAVDGDLKTAWRSTDVVQVDDHIGLALLRNLDPVRTKRLKLHVVMENPDAVLSTLKVETSPDGYNWGPPFSSNFVCKPTRKTSSIPDVSFPSVYSLSTTARSIRTAESDPRVSDGFAGWMRRRRRRSVVLKDCSIELKAEIVGSGSEDGERGGATKKGSIVREAGRPEGCWTWQLAAPAIVQRVFEDLLGGSTCFVGRQIFKSFKCGIWGMDIDGF